MIADALDVEAADFEMPTMVTTFSTITSMARKGSTAIDVR